MDGAVSPGASGPENDRPEQPPIWIRGCSDAACLEVAFSTDSVRIRNSTAPDGAQLLCTYAEWKRFVDLVRGGAFEPPVDERAEV